MLTKFFAYATMIGLGIAGPAFAQESKTLSAVKARSELNCGVSTGVQTALSTLDAKGNWVGFEVDFCRAVAAAVVGDPNKVKYVPLDIKTAFTTLQSGSIDLLARTTTQTFIRDVEMNLTWAGGYLYDTQAFIVNKSLGIDSALKLKGASICVSAGSNYELNLADYFRQKQLPFTPVGANTREQSEKNLMEGRCDAYTGILSGLAAARSKMPKPDEWVILPEGISLDIIGPVVRQDDPHFANVVTWTLNALVTAEELGVTAENVTSMRDSASAPDVQRLLGKTANFGAKLGLDNDWALRAIKAVGNYGEMYARHLGKDSPLKLERRLNALWKDGGLLISPPFR